MRGARAWSGAQERGGGAAQGGASQKGRKDRRGVLAGLSTFPGVDQIWISLVVVCLADIKVKTKKWSFEMISVHSGNTEKGISIFLIRTQLVSEEDSPTKMSDARWNPQLWFIFLPKIKSDDHIFLTRQNHQMGRTGIRSTRSRSSKEGAPRSHPSTLAGSLLEYTP